MVIMAFIAFYFYLVSIQMERLKHQLRLKNIGLKLFLILTKPETKLIMTRNLEILRLNGPKNPNNFGTI